MIKRPTYIRFIVVTDHKSKTRCTGVVASLRILGEEGRLPNYYLDYSKELFDKLDEDLPIPPFDYKNWKDSVCWFKDTATEWISLFREIIAILESCDEQVEMLFTETPGMIVYEDEFQIVAKSHKY